MKHKKKVEKLYEDPHKWAEFAINNIAGMGKFSSDKVVEQYATRIWDISPCPINEENIE